MHDYRGDENVFQLGSHPGVRQHISEGSWTLYCMMSASNTQQLDNAVAKLKCLMTPTASGAAAAGC